MAAAASASQRSAVHRLAVADGGDVGAATAKVVLELHRQAGERIGGSGNGGWHVVLNALGRRRLEQVELLRGLVFLSVLMIYAHVVAQLSRPARPGLFGGLAGS